MIHATFGHKSPTEYGHDWNVLWLKCITVHHLTCSHENYKAPKYHNHIMTLIAGSAEETKAKMDIYVVCAVL